MTPATGKVTAARGRTVTTKGERDNDRDTTDRRFRLDENTKTRTFRRMACDACPAADGVMQMTRVLAAIALGARLKARYGDSTLPRYYPGYLKQGGRGSQHRVEIP